MRFVYPGVGVVGIGARLRYYINTYTDPITLDIRA